MLSMTYLAVLEPGEDGSYGISFPDLPGCFRAGGRIPSHRNLRFRPALDRIQNKRYTAWTGAKKLTVL